MTVLLSTCLRTSSLIKFAIGILNILVIKYSYFAFNAMYHKDYSNFVRPTSLEPQSTPCALNYNKLNGEEARRLYLEEVQDARVNESPRIDVTTNAHSVPDNRHNRRKRRLEEIDTSNANLFLSAQKNDVNTLNEVLNACPDKISLVDEFGWSLLMIACQANSVEVVKELLKRGIDTSVRDKAGNSARTLVIKNKNLALADILLNTAKYEPISFSKTSVKLKEEYVCETCNNKVFPDKRDHLSSTVHNINASKGKKIPPSFKIPPSNKGYQIMLKEGWDMESGLGRNGCGNKYPIKAVQKLDRDGLGLQKKKSESTKECKSNKSKSRRDYHENRRFEVNFRREFY